MVIVRGELFESKADVLAVTTNSFLRRDEALVMGRGAALEAARRWPELPRLAGDAIARSCGHLGVYGWLVVEVRGRSVGLFQVKRHFKDAADPALIRAAVQGVAEYVQRTGKWVSLNFPGIGYGRLSREEVEPLLAGLPDLVTVHIREES